MTFNRLTAIEPTKDRFDKKIVWRFSCSCGKKHLATATHVRRGLVKSCGCLANEIIRARNFRHGRRFTREWRAWNEMMNRAHRASSKSKNNKYYKDRGVSVCERWQTFKNFYDDMGDCPRNYTLDRIDNDGSYEPDNCRWATMKQQANNRSNNKRITLNGKTQTLSEWESITGTSQKNISARLRLGWDIKEAIYGKNKFKAKGKKR